MEATMECESAELLGEGAELLGALEKMIRKTAPDKDNVRQLIEEVVDERLPRVIECHAGDMCLGSLEEHVRPEFDEIAMAVYAGVNVMLSGPAGCGKSHLARQVAKALGMRFGHVSFTGGMSESRLIGRFVPTGAQGQFQYVGTQFTDLYENGGLFLFDEMDAADPNVLLVVNAALANGELETPNPDKPILTRHPSFRAMAALNTWGLGADRQYVGRAQLDAASLDRWLAKFEVGYDTSFERKVGHPDLVAWVHEIRQAVAVHKVRRVVSSRMVLDGTKLMSGGFTLPQVQAMFLRDWTANEKNLVS